MGGFKTGQVEIGELLDVAVLLGDEADLSKQKAVPAWNPRCHHGCAPQLRRPSLRVRRDVGEGICTFRTRAPCTHIKDRATQRLPVSYRPHPR